MVEALFTMDERTEHLNHYSNRKQGPDTMFTLKFHAVRQSDGRTDAERERFAEMWDATPSGEIKLGVINQEAAAFFRPGATYRVMFEEVPEPKK